MKSNDQLSRYLRAVGRRLPLPKAYRARVLRDLQSSIDARREAGQTDAEILAALGAPAQTAKELCEGMQAHVYRKSPWRFVFLAIAAVAAPALFSGGFSQLLLALTNASASVGVIGGADGPTAIFIAANPAQLLRQRLICAAALFVGLAGYFLLRRCRPKQD